MERDDKTAKFWSNPVRLQGSNGFKAHELRDVQRTVESNEQEFLEAWHEYFGKARLQEIGVLVETARRRNRLFVAPEIIRPIGD